MTSETSARDTLARRATSCWVGLTTLPPARTATSDCPNNLVIRPCHVTAVTVASLARANHCRALTRRARGRAPAPASKEEALEGSEAESGRGAGRARPGYDRVHQLEQLRWLVERLGLRLELEHQAVHVHPRRRWRVLVRGEEGRREGGLRPRRQARLPGVEQRPG